TGSHMRPAARPQPIRVRFAIGVEVNDLASRRDGEPRDVPTGQRRVANADHAERGVVVTNEPAVRLEDANRVVVVGEDAPGAVPGEGPAAVEQYVPVRHDVDEASAAVPPSAGKIDRRASLGPVGGWMRGAAHRGERQSGKRDGTHVGSIAPGCAVWR